MSYPLPKIPPAADSISKTLSKMTPGQLLEVIVNLKVLYSSKSKLQVLSQANPTQARELLTQNPQLSYAILQCLLKLNLVDANVIQVYCIYTDRQSLKEVAQRIPATQPTMPVSYSAPQQAQFAPPAPYTAPSPVQYNITPNAAYPGAVSATYPVSHLAAVPSGTQQIYPGTNVDPAVAAAFGGYAPPTKTHASLYPKPVSSMASYEVPSQSQAMSTNTELQQTVKLLMSYTPQQVASLPSDQREIVMQLVCFIFYLTCFSEHS